jgi:hypothetical protein
MKTLLVVLYACALALISGSVLADGGGNDMTALTPAQTAQMKAERDAAKAKWATMTPEQKAAATQAMRAKRQGDLNAMELMAQNDDMTAMTKAETAQLKAERAAAQAKYAKMTPDEKAAVRKAARQKRLAEMNMMERVGQDDDMGRYMSY